MPNIFTVFGATGAQGGSVVNAILADPTLSKKYELRGITRDASTPAAKALSDRGVNVVIADMSSPESLDSAVAGSHTVFLVTNFWDTGSGSAETAQGKAVVDACKAAGVQHLIFSSLLNTSEISGDCLARIAHFDSKAAVEEYIRETGVPATFVLLGWYMENFFQMLRKEGEGYIWSLPIDGDKAQLPLIDAGRDTGNFVKAALKQTVPSGKRILVATEYLTPNRIVSDLAEITGKHASAVRVSDELFKSFMPPGHGQELLENHLLLEDPGYFGGADLGESLALLDERPRTWREFVEANKGKWA
ncbi:related to nitrogen metabolic regulation protein nmr [Cephalotrichum gorgonifer]|uniref:Related to nitrogen metabolic regulation protein nmr n=1 Tax=Cephalotrichum gorgonifer TaxID=2041049 RepID=A0AAE8MRV6_9PEZI|nr:related to nitrogen metabolic regulation protein nmr [Cephalotrichum gorgonifer]